MTIKSENVRKAITLSFSDQEKLKVIMQQENFNLTQLTHKWIEQEYQLLQAGFKFK